MLHPLLVGTTTTVPDVSVGRALLQMVLALAVIVGGIWALSKVLARVRAPKVRGDRKPAGSGLRILSRQALGKDLSIASVRWNDREVLVGISGSTITFLNDARSEELPAAVGDGEAEKPADPETGRVAAMFAHPSHGLKAAGGGVAGRPSFIDSLRQATLRR